MTDILSENRIPLQDIKGSSTELITPIGRFQGISDEIRRRASALSDKIRGALSKQQDTKKIEEVREALKDLGEPIQEESGKSESEIGIGIRFVQTIEEKGIAMKRDEPNLGISVLAAGGTNERTDIELVEKLKKQSEAPNGYLIGVGAGNIFTMLDAFKKGREPKAIIMLDIDSTVIEYGAKLIDGFRNSPDFGEQRLRDKTDFSEVDQAIRKHGPLLHKLATEGNLVIARANFMDTRLTEELASLPDIHNANNLIYLSNIADPIYEIGHTANSDYIPSFQHLDMLTPQPPHTNYYADTLRFPMQYDVRFRKEIPQFSPDDFSEQFNTTANMFGTNKFRSRPLDEIEQAIAENPVFEDLSSWDIQRIVNAYHLFRESSSAAERAIKLVESISNWRKEAIDKKDEYIEKSKQPPSENSITIENYIAPQDDVVAELSLDYNFDKDYIPYISEVYWQNADTPGQIDLKQLPNSNKKFVNDPTTGKLIITFDMANVKKGKIEESAISRQQGLSFEEMAMAKLYREAKNRVLTQNQNATITGKSLDELVQMLKV